jgi:hypothetical protein
MAADKRTTLVNKLHHRTVAGNAGWERTIQDGVYQISFPGYTLRISKVFAGEEYPETPDYVIEIHNMNDVLIDEFSDRDLAPVFEGGGAFATMEDIYIRARRIAEGVDKAIDDILSSLDDEQGIAF